jgi:hypothetical protein
MLRKIAALSILVVAACEARPPAAAPAVTGTQNRPVQVDVDRDGRGNSIKVDAPGVKVNVNPQ